MSARVRSLHSTGSLFVPELVSYLAHPCYHFIQCGNLHLSHLPGCP